MRESSRRESREQERAGRRRGSERNRRKSREQERAGRRRGSERNRRKSREQERAGRRRGSERSKRGRREFLAALGVGATASLAGCSAIGGREPFGAVAPPDAPVVGRIVDLTGDGLADAAIDAFRAGERVAGTTTDDAGRFRLDVGVGAVWLRATHTDHVASVRAAAPGERVRLELTPDQATVTLCFGGDVMFGRRFYERTDDPLSSHAVLDPGDVDAHRRILRHVAPPLESVDVASVNLETPLTTSPWRHPTKTFTFASRPAAAEALAAAGVDYVALGNTHTLDALTPGLEDTRSAVSQAGLAASGAGDSSASAWEPAVVERGGTTIAYVSCTTTAGQQYDLDWSADRTADREYVVEGTDGTLTVPGGVGVAEGSPPRIREAVAESRERADVVVVQVHGGDEYRRTPTTEIEALTDAAVAAGADLVVNHHPHVTGGLEVREGTPVAWTLGNLVFDQTLWTTYRSYLLFVDVVDGAVRRARVEPLLLEGYVPKGITGLVRRRLLWETAGYSGESFELDGEDLQFVAGRTRQPARRRRRFEADDGLFAREAGWIADLTDVEGRATLGRDRLLVGSFEDVDVDAERGEGTLWRFGRTRESSGAGVGYRDSGGVELLRVRGNESMAVLTPQNRIPIDGAPLTFVGRYDYAADEGLELLVSWYDATEGSSFARESIPLPPSGRGWGWTRHELDPPPAAASVDVFLRLSPPSGTEVRRAAFDDLRLVEWEPAATGGREFDHLRVEGRVDATVVPVGPNSDVDADDTDAADGRWRRIGE